MLDVGHLRQLRSWSCGPACVRMVLRYFGRDVAEADLVESLGATESHGTNPRTLTAYLRAKGFVARSKSMRNLADLSANIARGRPVIVAWQAHGPPHTDYATSWDHGHYSVVIGADEECVTLVDPSSRRPRRHVPAEQFLARWRDLTPGPRPKVYTRWGLSVGNPRT